MSVLTDIQAWPGGYCDICYTLLMDAIETEARRCAKCRLAVVIAASTECAAGAWRYDVENAPRDGSEVLLAWRDVFGAWHTETFRWNTDESLWMNSDGGFLDDDIIRAFAAINPPQVKP